LVTSSKKVVQLKLGHVHQIINSKAPSYLLDYFSTVRNRHNYSTRSSRTAFVVPRFNTLVGRSSFRFTGTMEWNLLPIGAQTMVEKFSFKKYVKHYLLESVLEEESSQYI